MVDRQNGLSPQRESGSSAVGLRLNPQQRDAELVAEGHDPAASKPDGFRIAMRSCARTGGRPTVSPEPFEEGALAPARGLTHLARNAEVADAGLPCRSSLAVEPEPR